MKIHLATATIACLIGSTSASAWADNPELVEMLRRGVLQERQNCTKAFPDMTDFFKAGFSEFAKANSNYVSLERWNDSSAVGASTDLPGSRAWCMDFFHRNGKFDEMISTIFDEQ